MLIDCTLIEQICALFRIREYLFVSVILCLGDGLLAVWCADHDQVNNEKSSQRDANTARWL